MKVSNNMAKGGKQMNIGEKIIEIRKERKMTQEDLAKIFHVTRQTVSNLLRILRH